jgi:hypothetical protein
MYGGGARRRKSTSLQSAPARDAHPRVHGPNKCHDSLNLACATRGGSSAPINDHQFFATQRAFFDALRTAPGIGADR